MSKNKAATANEMEQPTTPTEESNQTEMKTPIDPPMIPVMGEKMKLAIAEIEIPETRHRKVYTPEAMEELKESIRKVGVLQPPIITPSKILIAGGRRIKALQEMGITETEFLMAPDLNTALLLATAELHENTCRQPFTPSEAVAAGKEYEKLLREEQERARSNGKKQGGNAKTGKPRAPKGTGKVQDLAAQVAGMSPETYRKAAKVIEQAKKDPQDFADIAEKMDKTGSVDRAYSAMNRRLELSKKPSPSENGDGGSEEEAVKKDADGIPIPKRLLDKFGDDGLDSALIVAKEIKKEGAHLLGLLNGVAEWNPWLRIEKVQEDELDAIREHGKMIGKALNAIMEMVNDAKPIRIHKACEGKGCKLCRRSGFLPGYVKEE